MDSSFFFKNETLYDLANSLDSFMSEARTLRERLGDRAALVDVYIDHLLEMTTEIYSSEVAEDGFDAAGDLFGLCRRILSGEDMTAHPFHAQAAAYIAAHPVNLSDSGDKAWAYVVPLFGRYLEQAANMYVMALEGKMRAAVPAKHMDRLETEINAALGDDTGLLAALLLSIREYMCITPAMAVYMRGFQYQMIDALRHKDALTGRQVYQELLDHPLPRA